MNYPDDDKLNCLLPKEIWTVVLKKLRQQNLENVINSCTFFRNLRWGKRTSDNITAVIGILAESFEQRLLTSSYSYQKKNVTNQTLYYGNDVEKTLNTEQNFNGWNKHGMKKTNTDDNKSNWVSVVLKCRLVTSSWNNAVEMVYQQKKMTGFPELVDNETDLRSPFNHLRIKWTTQKFTLRNGTGDPTAFLAHFKDSHLSINRFSKKNPFIGRNLVIEISLNQETREQCLIYLNSLITVLEHFGHEIMYCSVLLVHSSLSPVRNVQILQSMLNLLPNLKFLRIAACIENQNNNIFEHYPLPKLEKLEVLCLANMESQMATEMIRQNSQVQGLNICFVTVPETAASLLNNISTFSTMASDCGEMLARFGTKWKLKKFGIESNEIIDGVKLFKMLQVNWSDSLADVILDNPFSRDINVVNEQSKNLRLKLPHVQRLSVISYHPFFIDFAIPLQNSLQFLEICWDKQNNENMYEILQAQTIEIVGFLEILHQSNIWNFFPFLKAIKIELLGIKSRLMVYKRNGNKIVYRHNY